jgi:hypothetical protein
MIIFNLWAVLVVPLIILICLPFYTYFPELMKGPHEALVLGIIVTVIGGITDYVGLKGRLFFLPIWLIGIGIICYQIGVVGMTIFAAIAAVGIYFLIRQNKKRSAADWKKAQEELAKTPAPEANWDAMRLWQWVQATLFFPIFRQTPEMRSHNMKVMNGITSVRPELSQDEAKKFFLFHKFLEESKDDPKSKMLDGDLEKSVRGVIEKKLADLKKKPAGKQPPPIPANA